MKYLILFIACLLLSFQLFTIQSVIKDIEALQQVKELPYTPKNKVLGIQITQAIIQVETGGKSVKGKSGEFGVAQFLPSTWRSYTSKYMGTTTLPITPENEFEVLTLHNEYLLNKGYTIRDVILVHNQGSKGACRRGINKHNVRYDSCAYVQSVMNKL